MGDGYTGCDPVKGKPVDYCVDLDNVGLFTYVSLQLHFCRKSTSFCFFLFGVASPYAGCRLSQQPWRNGM